MIIDSFPDRLISSNGQDHLYFGGTSYLGMTNNREFLKILYKNLKKWGSNYGSSRQANIQLSIYQQAEQVFSKFLYAEGVLTLSSGTLAGKLVIETLDRSKPQFFHIAKTHPAILHRKSMEVFTEGKLNATLLDQVKQEVVICTDAILSSQVEPTSFEFLQNISQTKSIVLLVDESHSLGIVGQNGHGVYELIDKKRINRLIRISSLSKAYGLTGGLIASDSAFIEAIKKEATFISASAANPAYLATFIEAQHLFKKQTDKLRSNLEYISKNLKPHADILFNKAYPVIYSKNDAIFRALLKNNIIISRFNYPTYNKAMNRIVITANHTKKDLKILIKNLNSYDK